MMKKIVNNWYWFIVGGFLLFVVLLYSICGENSYIAIHDNLDLFVAQYQMMKNTNTFLAHHVNVPFLGGITRDNLPSELSLGTCFYMLFPSFVAYVMNYITKVILAIVSFILLGKELYKKDYAKYKSLIVLSGLAYGMLNVFPAFGIPFATIPLLIWILLRIYNVGIVDNIAIAQDSNRSQDTEKTGFFTKNKKLIGYYGLLLIYPFVSYFSYFGLFACGYLVVAWIWVSIYEKKINLRLLISIPVLAIGNVICEYRLFGVMLFSDEVTIRSTMVGTDFTFGEVLREIWDVFCHGIFHADAVHTKVILPLCLVYFVGINAWYILKKNVAGIWKDPFNLVMLWLMFNSIIYGLYDFLPVRSLIETLVPPLEGWQFNRTVFFNPFLWYAALFLLAKKIYDIGIEYLAGAKIGQNELISHCTDADNEKQSMSVCDTLIVKKMNWKMYTMYLLSHGIVLLSMVVILLTDTRYNDLFHTSYYTLLHVAKGKEIDTMNYREFYGTELFEQVKQDIGYNGEWSVAYGFHPAVLEYNGIATLDGYLGFYSQDYKEAFRKVIAPAIDRVEASRIYYDDWGARAYLYSGTEDSIVSASKSFDIQDHDLYMDVDAFKALNGQYIFSRYEISNCEECGLDFMGKYESDSTPYAIYVYDANK